MVQSAAKTVDAYLKELPKDRRDVVAKVRDAVNKNMPEGFEEAMSFGMIGWGIPLSRYPNTYNKQPLAYVALAAQKNNYALYLMGCYVSEKSKKQLAEAYKKAGKKLDMGKSCLRFTSLDDLELAAIGKIIAAGSVDGYIAYYETVKPPSK